MSKRLYVPVIQFYMSEDLGYAYGTLGRAFGTYDEARQFLLDGGWKSSSFYDDVFDETIEFFGRDNGDEARIDEVKEVRYRAVAEDSSGWEQMAMLTFEEPPKRSSRGGRRRGPYLYEEYIPIVEEFLASGEQYGHITDESVTNILLRNRVESALWHSSDRMAAIVRMYDGDVYLVRRKDC